MTNILDVKIEDLPVSNRIKKAVRGVPEWETLRDVLADEPALYRVPNLGRKSVEELLSLAGAANAVPSEMSQFVNWCVANYDVLEPMRKRMEQK